MASTITKIWQGDSYANGPGRATTIGTSFLRICQVLMDTGTTTVTMVPADFGLTRFDTTLNLLSKTAGITLAETSFSPTSVTITVSGDSTFRINMLGKGQ